MKCKRLSAAILSLVMIISLLPTTALAAEKNNVWSTAYDEIRVYMDDATKADHDNLEGILPKQVRLYTSKALLGEYVFCTPGGSYWEYSNRLILPKHKVTARDITNIDLARDKATGHSPTISIPIEGNTKYKVTVSEGKGGKYLRIDITRRTPHTVTYVFDGDNPGDQYLPASEQATATTKVTLPDVTTPITGTLNGKDGTWTFNGWQQPEGITFTDNDTKFTMPDENVTVTGTWTFEATPPTGTPVYVYFQTVNTAGEPIENVKGVKHNENGNGWATLGELKTTTVVTPEKKDALGAKVIEKDGFTYYSGNDKFNLDLIKSWDALHLESGAVDYVKAGDVWHLDGTVYGYRAIYCDSDRKELTDFAPNKTPEYYLEGTAGIKVTDKKPTDPAGKEFDCWVTNDVKVAGDNTFTMPHNNVIFTPQWKTGTLVIQKVLEDNSPAAGKTFSFTVTPGNKTVEITGKDSKTISDLPVGDYTVTEDSSTAAVSNYTCKTQYSTDGSTWKNDPITVPVTHNSTVTVYVKNSYTPITADLIDDNIIIKHGVNVNGAPADGDDDDTTAHIVEKNATISYQATLDMKNLDFGANPEHADTVLRIRTAMADIGTASLWDFIKNNSIGIFAGSEVNLHVKFSEELVNPATLNGITLESGWFKRDPASNPTYDETTKYWTIPCVIKDATDAPDIDTNDSIITLSGITLPLTADAQDKLNSNTALDIISEGYIDGTIMISGQTLKLESKTAKNTAKLKLAVPTYSVTYDANGGSGTMTDKKSPYAYGTAATVLTNGFTCDGYTFTGWNTQADGKGTSCKAGDSIDVTGNIVLYAQWTRNSSHDNDDDKYFFAIQKVDAQDGHALNGAVFELYQLDKDGEVVNRRVTTTRRHSSENGIALFSVSATKTSNGGSTWYYREITAPEGYVLDTKEYEISARDFYYDDQSKAVAKAKTVRNYRGTTPDLLNDSDHFAYVIGYMDGNVRPYGLISRAETTTIFFRLLKDSVRDGNLLTSNTYTDVPDDYWANTAISTMTGLGIVQGRSTTTFDPKAPITRAQFAAICARFDTGKSNGEQTFSDIQGHWAEKYIERAAELGWIKGFEDGTFRPDTYITRAQAMTMINRVLNRIPEENSDLLPGMNVWPDCNPGDWFYLAVQEATNSHDFEHKAGNYETWTGMNKDPDWTRYEN